MIYLAIKSEHQGYEEMTNAQIIDLTELEDNGLLVDMKTYLLVGDYSFISLN